MFGKLYSQEYIEQPKLYKLKELNNIEVFDFLSGSEEAEYAEEEKWLDIAKSSKAKVDVIYDFLSLAISGKLKVENKFNDQKLIFQDRMQYFIYETVSGRFLFWFIVTILGVIIGIVLDRLL